MARQIVPLTDGKCRQAKYSEAGSNRLFDGGGLYLELARSGAKRWRMKYRRPVTRKENVLTFGDYPSVSLVRAREARAGAQAQLAAGIDPAIQREIDRLDAAMAAADTFKAIAEEWLATREGKWSAGYMSRMRGALKNNVYATLGNRPIAKIPGKMVLDAVKQVERRGALEMASRVLSAIGMVFRYAVGTGRVHADVTQGLEQFLATRPEARHFPHVSTDNLPSLLWHIERYHGRPETRLAIKLMMRTFPRTNELRWGEWSEIDFDGALWTIPSERMKGSVLRKASGVAHLVPLSRQAVDILRELQEYSGRYRFMFPGIRRPAQIPMSGETMNKALKIMGFGGDQTGHGFRGLASTIMNEQSGVREKVIDRQLSHRDRNKVRRAYNHAEYMEKRVALMQWWSDYLDIRLAEAKPPAEPYPQVE